MPCTRQHMEVMQHCVLGCRSAHREFPPDSIFEKMLEKIRHLFCDLVCQDYAALDPDQEDVRYGFFSQVKSLDHGFFGFGVRWLGNLKFDCRGGKPVQPWQRRLDFRLGTDIQCILARKKLLLVKHSLKDLARSLANTASQKKACSKLCEKEQNCSQPSSVQNLC